MHLLSFVVILSLFSTASFAAEGAKYCVGSYQDTQYGSIAGQVRYELDCDGAKPVSFSRFGCYSDACQDKFRTGIENTAIAKMGKVRLGVSELNFTHEYALYGAKPGATVEYAFIHRSLSSHRGKTLETLITGMSGRVAHYDERTIAGPSDYSNDLSLAREAGYAIDGKVKLSPFNGGAGTSNNMEIVILTKPAATPSR